MIEPTEASDINELRKHDVKRTLPDRPLTIPVIEERIIVDKKTVESGKVRIVKTVSEKEEQIDIPVLQENVEVERIPVNRFVETAPQIRYEGDTMIVPILREVVVIEKRIELVEELRITKRTTQTQVFQEVTLRTEDIQVERIPNEIITPLSNT